MSPEGRRAKELRRKLSENRTQNNSEMTPDMPFSCKIRYMKVVMRRREEDCAKELLEAA